MPSRRGTRPRCFKFSARREQGAGRGNTNQLSSLAVWKRTPPKCRRSGGQTPARGVTEFDRGSVPPTSVATIAKSGHQTYVAKYDPRRRLKHPWKTQTISSQRLPFGTDRAKRLPSPPSSKLGAVPPAHAAAAWCLRAQAAWKALSVAAA